ncbi:hypothetical protein RFI_26240 [Reticulomyxa filosa]|uniref:Uncharacterized protein n=1 Tax=Reticulomyxa filosa TaxID=46433 RepID=X6MBT0_RETFI|nr:hypothetical protein RFI_26240 [Reticulomyxa filosa]|eukprot:ETO11136.1 hypothetical protein RFI_26240 [Reticulomyxa filosa]
MKIELKLFNTKFKNKSPFFYFLISKFLHCKIVVTLIFHFKMFLVYTLVQFFLFLNKSSNIFFVLHHQKTYQEKTKKSSRINLNLSMKDGSKILINSLPIMLVYLFFLFLNVNKNITILFNKVSTVFIFDTFRSSSKLINTFTDMQAMCGALIMQYLMIVYLFVLDQVIKQFVYGMLITTNKFNHSMDIQIL